MKVLVNLVCRNLKCLMKAIIQDQIIYSNKLVSQLLKAKELDKILLIMIVNTKTYPKNTKNKTAIFQ